MKMNYLNELLKWEYDENEKTLKSNGKCLSSKPDPDQTEVWAGRLSGGYWVVLLLNRATFTAEVEIKWSEISLNATSAFVRDLWEQRDLGQFNESYKVNLSSHESQVLKAYLLEIPPEPEPETENNGLVLGIMLGALALLLLFIAFLLIYMNYKKKKEEYKEVILTDEENIDENIIRETKNSVIA